MRLSESLVLKGGTSNFIVRNEFSSGCRSFLFIVALLYSSQLIVASASDSRESHLLPNYRSSGEKMVGLSGKSQSQSNRAGRSHLLADRERAERAETQIFRMELLRQIKAIDHMKCFPKVLCGLSVDSDKSFGINKSNFVRSYLELMRNIKRPMGGGLADERFRTEDEVEKDLIWPFSPHNPDRKHHSSFERISSGAMSASVEHGDQESHEYLSRGIDSRNMYGSMSVEKIDRMGVLSASIESKEEKLPTVTSTITRADNSKIPGEKKNKKNANKSLTAKITSYFTSWLPEMPVTFSWGTNADSNEKITDGVGRNMNDDLIPSPELLANLPEIMDYWMTTPLKQSTQRKARTEDDVTDDGFDDGVSRDDLYGGSRDTDIYHTAVNIGKRLKDPKQCDYIYNGCPLEYNRILDMIGSLKTEIQPHEDTAEVISQELGLDMPIPTTTTTTSTTSKPQRPQRKKKRPSTKISHVLPNGEKVEINFRLGGSEDSEETSSSAQRDYSGKKENIEYEISSEKDNKNSDEVVIDLGQRTALTSTEEVISSEKRASLTSRKGSPVDTAIIKNKLSSSVKKKLGFHPPKKNIISEMRNEDMQEGSEEMETQEQQREQDVVKSSGSSQQKQKPTLKLSGLTLTTNNDEQPLEISPSYVIIKHQPLSVHTTSLLSPDNLPQSQQHSAHDKLQTFQLVQNGQQIDADQITDQLKHYIRQSGGLIPKLSLHSSGLITTDTAEALPIAQTSYGGYKLDQHTHEILSSQQKLHPPNSNPYAAYKLESVLAGAINKLVTSTQPTLQQAFTASFPQSPYSSYQNLYRNSPEMVGAVPGRMDFKPKSTTTSTTTSTTSTTTEKIILPGMQETVTFDTDEVTDDTMKKLESDNSVPGWISKTSDQNSAESRESESEEDDEQSILENLNKTLLSENTKSKYQYKNPEKKKTRVKANSSRVRTSLNRERNKGQKKKGSSSINSRYTISTGESDETSVEREVIKHAGPYSSPTVYKSPLKGPGPHGGAYPYLTMPGQMFPGYPPFWRM